MASEESITSRITRAIGTDPVYESLTPDTEKSRLQLAGQRILEAGFEVAELLRNNGVMPPMQGLTTPNPVEERLSMRGLKIPTLPESQNFWLLDLHFARGSTKTWGTGLLEHGKLIRLPEGSGVGNFAKLLFTYDYIPEDERSLVVPELRAQKWCDRLVTFGATVMKGEFYNPALTGHGHELPAPPPRLLPPEQPRYYPTSVETSSPTRFIPAGTGLDDTRR